MNALSSMVEKLRPLRVYSLDEDSIVYAELAAFAVGFDLLRAELDLLLKEAFVSTAEDFGITNLEREVGSVREDLSLDRRRQMLINRLSFGEGDFTPAGFEKMLRILGVAGEFEEYPAAQRMTLKLESGEYTLPQRLWIAAQASALLPAHLECDVVFPGLDWLYIDSLDNTFAVIDKKGYIWRKIDFLL